MRQHNRTSLPAWLPRIALFVMMLALVAACGPAPESTTTSDVDPFSSMANGGEDMDSIETEAEADSAETAPDDTPAEAPETADVGGGTATEIDSTGLPVGFTTDGNPYRGSLDAPVVIEEFSDFQCPFCSRFFTQTLPSIEQNQVANGDAVIIFYDFPLTSIHPQAFAAHAAARCAGDNGAASFWAMHDLLFANLGDWSINNPSPVFVDYAAQIGLDSADFSDCLTSGKHDDAIEADMALGRSRGVNGTPAFFINDQLLSGAQPVNVFDQAITAAKNGEPVAGASSGGGDSAEIEIPDPTIFSDNYSGALGDADAKVTIVEFTDYQCPFCARHSQETFPSILSDMIEAGRVRYILKDLPLDSLHPEARIAAVAARCAGEQDVYWEMHDALFDSQSSWGGGGEAAAIEQFMTLADELGIDGDAFNSCVTSDRYDDAIQANVDEATSQGVQGTPFFFVDGYPVINGAQPFEVFEIVVGYAEEDQLVAEIEKAIQRQQEQAQQQQQQQQEQAAPGSAEPVDVEIGDAITIGSADAPVTIVEYTDFQCPFCSRHYTQTFPRIVSDYVDQGLVRYVFKDFPLTQIHPQAVAAHEAARCAADQDAFLEMHGALFSGQSEWGNPNADSVFINYAEELGLDTAAFESCLTSDQYVDAINADLEEGIGLGVRGTPAFFINGRLVSGAQPIDVFQQVIAQELEGR